MNSTVLKYVFGSYFVAGTLLCSCSLGKPLIRSDLNISDNSRFGAVVVSKTEIKRGDQIHHNMVSAQAMVDSKIPPSACVPKVVPGSHANHDIFAGKVICFEDLEQRDWITEVSVYAVKDIPGGTYIGIDDVKSIPETGTCHAVDKRGRCTSVVGRWAKIKISKGQKISEQDLFPG